MGIYKEVFEDETPSLALDSCQAQIAELKLEIHRLSQDRLKAIAIINRVGEEMIQDENWRYDITKPIKSLGVNKLADSAVEIKVLGETRPGKQWDAKREFQKRIKIAFDREGIEIPYPHRTIINKN